jgi:zinc/manganese transport system ATP-binding protein
MPANLGNSMEQNNVINVKNLTAGYGSHIVWQDANFSINKGEFVAVLGPNGAGKTTLFRLLLGLVKPISGQIELLGAYPKKGNAKIGYVPQRHPIDSETKIATVEFVRLGLDGDRWGISFSQEGTKQALEVLKVVGALELAYRPLGVLSGGELQRVFLAQALIGSPDLLLLDEPLANLDIRREGEFVKLIKSIVVSRNITVLLIAHNINPLLSVLDKVVYIANGKVAIGNSVDVLNSKTLSGLYDAPIEVLRDSYGRVAIVGAEENIHHHE